MKLPLLADLSKPVQGDSHKTTGHLPLHGGFPAHDSADPFTIDLPKTEALDVELFDATVRMGETSVLDVPLDEATRRDGLTPFFVMAQAPPETSAPAGSIQANPTHQTPVAEAETRLTMRVTSATKTVEVSTRAQRTDEETLSVALPKSDVSGGRPSVAVARSPGNGSTARVETELPIGERQNPIAREGMSETGPPTERGPNVSMAKSGTAEKIGPSVLPPLPQERPPHETAPQVRVARPHVAKLLPEERVGDVVPKPEEHTLRSGSPTKTVSTPDEAPVAAKTILPEQKARVNTNAGAKIEHPVIGSKGIENLVIKSQQIAQHEGHAVNGPKDVHPDQVIAPAAERPATSRNAPLKTEATTQLGEPAVSDLAKPDGERPADRPFGPEASMSETRRSEGVTTTGSSFRPETQRTMIAQLVQVPLKPDQPVELRLDPQELGQVRMVLTSQDQALTLVMSAERPETLDLMRRHIDQLAQEFHEMGYTDLNFSFADQQSETDQRGDARRATPLASDHAETDAQPQIVTLGGSGGLDIRL